MLLRSIVPGFEGQCKVVWLNRNQVYNRLDGGVSGFFRLVKRVWIFDVCTGEEFHGILLNGSSDVTSTKRHSDAQ